LNDESEASANSSAIAVDSAVVLIGQRHPVRDRIAGDIERAGEVANVDAPDHDGR
jgi:hypothetical protein